MFKVKGLYSPTSKAVHLGPIKDLAIEESDIVLDLGAHIGTFTKIARTKCKNVVAVEANPDVFPFLKLNCPDCTLIQAAVVGNSYEYKEIVFFKDSRPAKITATVVRKRNNGERILVPTIKLSELMLTYKPTILKVDVEGQEYNLDLPTNLTGVRIAAISYHKSGCPMRAVDIPTIHAKLLALGFSAIVPPN